MANNEPCKHCGCVEALHDIGEARDAKNRPCKGFVSAVKHKRGCPIIGCFGDCEASIKRARDDEEFVRRRRQLRRF